MLEHAHSFATFSTDNIDEAAKFYGEKLGLAVDHTQGMLKLKLASGPVVVYPKEGHEPAKFTVLNFKVDDIAKTMETLRAKDITFEKYDGEGGITTDEDGVATWGDDKGAWFKDPAGNIIGLFEGGEEI